MKRDLALSLREKAEEIAEWMSREKQGYANHTFMVAEVRPLSEFSGVLVLNKSDGKKALVFCYWSEFAEKWRWFLPKESHIVGMERLREFHLSVEAHNFGLNKPEEKQLAEFV